MREEKKYNVIDKRFILFILGFILFLFGIVYTLTRPSLAWTIKLSDKGTIGDAIGGITGPAINLLSIIFLYISFKTQISANNIQRKQLEEEKEFNTKNNNFSSLMTVFQSLKDDYNNLTIRNADGIELFGKAALNYFANKFKRGVGEVQLKSIKNANLVKDFLFVINEYHILIDRIDKSNLEEDDRNLMVSLLINYYNTKLSYQVDQLITLCSDKAIMPKFKEKLQETRFLTEDITKRRSK